MDMYCSSPCGSRVSSVQFSCSVVSDSLHPLNHSTPALPVITNSRSSLKLMSIELVMPSNHLILCCPLLLLPSIFHSSSVFSDELTLHIRWPKQWSFSFSINPSNEYIVLISFKMDWLDLLADQGTLKSLLQHHSSKASILEKEMATHSSNLAWKTPWTEEPGRLQSVGSQESDTTQQLNHPPLQSEYMPKDNV